MYALNIDKETNRILSVCVVLPNGNYDNMVIVDSFPEGNVCDYLYIDGEYVYSPLPKPEEPEHEPAEMEQLRADINYLAIMTGVQL